MSIFLINLLSSITLFLVVLTLTILEKKYLNNFITPFTVTAWPFVFISLNANLVGIYLGFFEVSVRANLFILLNLVIIWFTGFLIAQFTSLPKKLINVRDIFSKYRNFRPIIIFLSWLIISSSLYKMVSLLTQEGITYIASGEFESKMSRGIQAHIIQFGIVILILYVLILWNHKKKLIDYMTIFGLGLSIVTLMIKYPIIWTVLIIFFIKNINQVPSKQLKKIVSISLTVISLFLLNFIVLFFFWGTFKVGSQKASIILAGWTYNYIFSGPILLEQWLSWPNTKPWWSLNIVFINLINVITGNPERLSHTKYISPGFIPISADFYSNVGTSFGVYYIIGDVFFCLLMTIIVSVISYLLYFRCLTKTNPINIFLTSLFLVIGFLSFFGQYFTVVTFYEMPILYMLVIGVMNFFKGLERK